MSAHEIFKDAKTPGPKIIEGEIVSRSTSAPIGSVQKPDHSHDQDLHELKPDDIAPARKKRSAITSRFFSSSTSDRDCNQAHSAQNRPDGNQMPEHDAEKWAPVFGKTSCENKKLARRFEFIKTHHAPGVVFLSSIALVWIVGFGFFVSQYHSAEIHLDPVVTGSLEPGSGSISQTGQSGPITTRASLEKLSRNGDDIAKITTTLTNITANPVRLRTIEISLLAKDGKKLQTWRNANVVGKQLAPGKTLVLISTVIDISGKAASALAWPVSSH